MAVGLVQSVEKIVTGQVNTTAVFGSNLTAGNLIVLTQVIWFNTATTIATPTDTRSHTYVACGAEQQASDTKGRIRSYYVENCTAGACTATLDATGPNSGDYSVSLTEFSGILTSGALDQFTSAGPTTSGSVDSGTTGTLAQAAELAYGGMTFSGATTTIAETGGYAVVQQDGAGDSNMPIGTEWKEVAATTGLNATWTLGASREWIAHVVTFKASGAAAAAPVRLRLMTMLGAG